MQCGGAVKKTKTKPMISTAGVASLKHPVAVDISGNRLLDLPVLVPLVFEC